MKQEVRVAVVIASFSGVRYLKSCLTSLKVCKGSFEVVVVDDGSDDGSSEYLRRSSFLKDKRFKLISLSSNMGAAEARNIGVLNSKGKYILFLDVDSKVRVDTISRLVGRLESLQDVGAVQARLDTYGHFLSWWGLPYEVNEPSNPIFAGRTAGLMIRREVFEKIGGFDEDYHIYGEDTDLCWRVWLSGSKIELVEEAVVDHVGKSSLSKKTKARVVGLGAKNSLTNIIKNADRDMLWWMLPLHFLAWSMMVLRLLIVGRVREAGAVVWGWWWNMVNLGKTVFKRKKVVRLGKDELRRIMFGNMGFGMLVRKGLRWWYEI